MYCVNKQVQGSTIPKEERKEYRCPRCKAQWTQLEVLDKIDYKYGFLCHTCSFPLVINEEADAGGHELSTKMNAQLRFITDVLPKIDQVVIPDNTFQVAYASRRPVERDALLNPGSNTVPVENLNAKPTGVKGLTNVGPTSIAVAITSTEGPTEEEKAAAAAKRAEFLAQNALPAHFTHSTVTGEQIIPAAPGLSLGPTVEESKDKKDIVTTPSLVTDGAAIDDYFAQLAAEQKREAEQEAEEEEEDDDDEDDMGFEDVIPTSQAATPSSTTGFTSALKRSAGTSSVEGTSTVNTPATGGPGTPDSQRAAKRVRINEPEVAAAAKDEDEESEEDMEFEDV
jgi:transcription initiation factor TFIIE subunit alpha